MITPDALGITRISDLSLPDMEKVRSVALIELTVTFDDHDIPLRHRRPAKTKNYPGRCFRYSWISDFDCRDVLNYYSLY